MPARDHNAVLIYLSGNNGSGKSSLGRALAPLLGFSHLPEEKPDHSYLCDLFSQPKRWSFEAQAHFLTSKAGLVRHSASTSARVLIDRSPYEDAEIFARYFRQARRLDNRAYRTYQQLYQALVQDLPEPDLIIYCRCSLKELERRVSQRGRDYEQLYPRNHLRVIDQLYRSWLHRVCRLYPGRVFSVDTEANNFITDEEALNKLTSDIQYLLTSPNHSQLELFSDDSSRPPTDENPRSYGMLSPLLLGHRIPPTGLLRRPTAYLAAPFTGKATLPTARKASLGEPDPQATFESWTEANSAHGKIHDSEYRAYLEWVESVVHKAGYNTFLPHRDVNKWGDRQLTPSQGASECTRHVFESDVLIALPELSLGAHYEVGVALGYGLPIVVLLPEGDGTSFIMQGLDSQPNVHVVRFSSSGELRERLANLLTSLAAHLLR
jgi:deoxyadenosine/deoxycytidine kinase